MPTWFLILASVCMVAYVLATMTIASALLRILDILVRRPDREPASASPRWSAPGPIEVDEAAYRAFRRGVEGEDD